MPVLKLSVEILILWVLYILYMAILVHRKGPLGGIFFYPKVVQDRVVMLPDLRDDAFTIGQIEVMGCPVLTFRHKEKTDKANLFLIGGGMVSAPRPGSVKKALRFAKETGLDVFVPYYPLCTDYPLTRAYEMIHAISVSPYSLWSVLALTAGA